MSFSRGFFSAVILNTLQSLQQPNTKICYYSLGTVTIEQPFECPFPASTPSSLWALPSWLIFLLVHCQKNTRGKEGPLNQGKKARCFVRAREWKEREWSREREKEHWPTAWFSLSFFISQPPKQLLPLSLSQIKSSRNYDLRPRNVRRWKFHRLFFIRFFFSCMIQKCTQVGMACETP